MRLRGVLDEIFGFGKSGRLESQGSQGSLSGRPDSRIEDALGDYFHLTSGRMAEILRLAGGDLNSPGIRTALSATFTGSMPDSHADLDALRDLLNEIERVLKIDALKTSLATSFNVTSNQVEHTLHGLRADINSAGIKAALNATLTRSIRTSVPTRVSNSGRFGSPARIDEANGAGVVDIRQPQVERDSARLPHAEPEVVPGHRFNEPFWA